MLVKLALCLVHLPEALVQSYEPSEDHSDCVGHAAAVSSQRSSVTGRDDRTGGFGNSMGHVSSVSSMWCGLPPGLVGSQLLGESQSRFSSAGCSTESRHAQSLIKIDENCPGSSISGPSSRRQAPVVSEFLPEICSPMPAASSGALAEKYDELEGSREVGASGYARLRPARWHIGGQRNQPRNRAATCAEVRSVNFGTMT